MLRLLNVLALTGLLGTAAWAYSVKYDTLYYAEAVKKAEKQRDREREAIAILEAEWQHLNKPPRLQLLMDRHLPLAPLQATQIIRAPDLPAKPPAVDLIGQKLDTLVTGSVPTPDRRKSTGRTPGAN